LNIFFLIILSNILLQAISNAFLVVVPIVDWLNLISDKLASLIKLISRVVLASPNPLADNISPVSASVKRTCNPKRVTTKFLTPSFRLTVSSSLTEKSYTSISTK
jgi:hypothetical protein